jgi:BirA family biotin operon repressor/biotin-[acetyl-CoA-carboxylase] ligase
VAHALEQCGVDAVALKWPNDVLLNGAKVGGILVEISTVAQPLQAIVGIGVNAGAGQSVSAQLGTPVGDIRASNPRVSRNVLAAELISSVHEMISRFEREGFHLIRQAWEALHAHQDRRIRIDGAGEAVFGVARGITDRGELIVETGSGVRYFSAGEVSLRGADVEP